MVECIEYLITSRRTREKSSQSTINQHVNAPCVHTYLRMHFVPLQSSLDLLCRKLALDSRRKEKGQNPLAFVVSVACAKIVVASNQAFGITRSLNWPHRWTLTGGHYKSSS